MREYRGKAVEGGRWVEGFWFVDPRSCQDIILDNDPNTLITKRHEIYEKTVGQYTGRDDSKKVKIFAGDLLKYSFEEKADMFSGDRIKSPGFRIIEIGFYKGCFCKRVVKQENCYFGKLPGDWENVFFSSFNKGWEIIGNIHDNPEILNKT